MLPFYAFYASCACPACGGSSLIDSGFRCVGLLAGGSPAASNFLLLRQKKVTKEKATRLSGSLRFATGNLRCPKKTGVGANSLRCASLKQRAALIPFLWRITGPDRTGQAGNRSQAAEQPNTNTNTNTNTHRARARARAKAKNTTNSIAISVYLACASSTFREKRQVLASESAPENPVLAGPVLGKESRIRAARCLSEASLRGPRLSLPSTGCPKRSAGTQTAGRLSFAYFSLAKQRKVSRRRAIPGQPNHAAKKRLRIQ